MAGCQGLIKSYNGLKGFGFITSDALEGDAMFSRTDLPRDALQLHGKFLEGRSVTFTVEAQADGRQKAKSIQIMNSGEDNFPGIIKTFSEKNGYGFLESSCITGDIRFDRKGLQCQATTGAELNGQLVVFQYAELPDGKLRASSVQLQSDLAGGVPNPMAQSAVAAWPVAGKGKGVAWMDPGAMKGGGCGKGAFGKGAIWSAPAAGPTWSPVPAQVKGAAWGSGSSTGASVAGTIKSFSEKNGYGFLAVYSQQEDVKFGQTDIVGSWTPAPGTEVTCTISRNSSGRLSATNVAPATGGMGQGGPAAKGAAWMGAGKGPEWMGKGAWANGSAWSAAGKGPAWSPAVAQATGAGWGAGSSASGTIKSFSEKNGYGFITGPGGEDIKFGQTDVLGLWSPAPGLQVVFEMSRNASGRLSASNVAPSSGNAGQKRPSSSMDAWSKGGGQKSFKAAKIEHAAGQHHGTIKSFNAQKGFGFIASPGMGEDIFFSKTELPQHMNPDDMGHGMATGVSVSFELMPSPDGRLKAQRLSF